MSKCHLHQKLWKVKISPEIPTAQRHKKWDNHITLQKTHLENRFVTTTSPCGSNISRLQALGWPWYRTHDAVGYFPAQPTWAEESSQTPQPKFSSWESDLKSMGVLFSNDCAPCNCPGFRIALASRRLPSMAVGHWIPVWPKGALELISDKSLIPAISASITATYNQRHAWYKKNISYIYSVTCWRDVGILFKSISNCPCS